MSGIQKSLSNKTSSKAGSKSRSQSRSKSKTLSLTSGRPPLVTSTKSKPVSAFNPQRSSLSAKRTRTVIRAHHVLQKRLARARADNDAEQIQELEAQLAASGGLETYQLASTVGQSVERGGDSSRVLVDWLRPEIEARRRRGLSWRKDCGGEAMTTTTTTTTTTTSAQRVPRVQITVSNKTSQSSRVHEKTGPLPPPPPPPPLRILEIGALSTTNALNMPRVTSVRRIDLRSSGPGIEEADFMTLPLPDSSDGSGEWEARRGYDVISLSLVLNYVPDARQRGDMLRRTTMFFSRNHENEDEDVAMHRQKEEEEEHHSDGEQGHNNNLDVDRSNSRQLLPCLFLVLPAPTLLNSRYLTADHLTDILSSLGYSRLEAKFTRKLHYSLWQFDAKRRQNWIAQRRETVFKKKEINPGSGRNNFCIVLDEPENRD